MITCGRNARITLTRSPTWATKSPFAKASGCSFSGVSGMPESRKPRSTTWEYPIASAAASSSARRTAGRSASISGRRIDSLRMSPASPPVQVTSRACPPRSASRRTVPAPLDDSSSGCACTVSTLGTSAGPGSTRSASTKRVMEPTLPSSRPRRTPERVLPRRPERSGPEAAGQLKRQVGRRAIVIVVAELGGGVASCCRRPAAIREFVSDRGRRSTCRMFRSGELPRHCGGDRCRYRRSSLTSEAMKHRWFRIGTVLASIRCMSAAPPRSMTAQDIAVVMSSLFIEHLSGQFVKVQFLPIGPGSVPYGSLLCGIPTREPESMPR